jgi:hypothetical protein
MLICVTARNLLSLAEKIFTYYLYYLLKIFCKMKSKLFLLMAFTGLIMAVGCSKENPDDPAGPDETPATVTVNPATVEATAASGTYSIKVTCNTAWDAASSADWCSIVKGDSVITVTVAENTAEELRTATVTVTAETATRTVTVTQAASQAATLYGTVEFTVTTTDYKTVTFYATAKSITVDWGNGSTEMYNNLDSTEVAYTLSGKIEHTIKIQAVEMSYFSYKSHTSAKVTALDVSNCSTLQKLDCRINQLSTLDVSKNTALTYLDCYDNQLSALDVSKNTALTYLDCSGNQLSTLDVSKNTALIRLSCSGNQLSTLDVSKNTALTYLDCSGNPLSTLDVSKNTALTLLVCGWNTLSTLDVSKNMALTGLYCSWNQLSTLDVSKNTALTGLSCDHNQLSTDALNKIFTDLPDMSDTEEYVSINIYNNPGTATCNRSIAINKNWTFF